MEYLSKILYEAKEELEATFDYDTTLDLEEQGFTFEELDKTYKLFFTHKGNKTILSIEQDAQGLYNKEFNANETMANVFETLEHDRIIYEAVESIQSGWQDEMCGSGQKINFMDYTTYVDEIKKLTQDKGIKADITTSFSGLAWEYLR